MFVFCLSFRIIVGFNLPITKNKNGNNLSRTHFEQILENRLNILRKINFYISQLVTHRAWKFNFQPPFGIFLIKTFGTYFRTRIQTWMIENFLEADSKTKPHFLRFPPPEPKTKRPQGFDPRFKRLVTFFFSIIIVTDTSWLRITNKLLYTSIRQTNNRVRLLKNPTRFVTCARSM